MATRDMPLVGIVMGSRNDWEFMATTAEVLDELQITHEVRVLSAHRTPEQTLEYAATANHRGLKAIVAGAGGAAHLAGVMAAKTILPVVGVPIPATTVNGLG